MSKPKLVLALALLLVPAGAQAQKLDKEEKKWLDEVRPIMLPDEEKTFKELKDKSDRAEFQKIFWARRDPDLETPANEYQASYNTARAEADAQFKAGGVAGSLTDCGRVYLLLGKPDDVKKEQAAGETPVFRGPEVWTFKDREGVTFTGGQIQIGFEGNCQLPQGARLGEQLNRLAANRILHPNIGYKKGSDGKIVKLADQLPKPSPGMTLLKQPRQDFTTGAETPLMLRTEDGATYVAGLVRGDAAALTTQDAGGKKTTKLVVVAQALDSAGKASATTERPIVADVDPATNSVLASFGMALKPGDYSVRVGLLDPATGKGSAVNVPVKAPDFQAGELAMSPLTILEDFQETAAAKDPAAPLADFAMTGARLIPRYGNVFTPSDSITVISQIYPRSVDETTGKPNVSSTYSILKDGKPVARAEEQPGLMAAVGPVPLKNYGAGKYVVQLKVKDNVTKKEYTQEQPFEVKLP
jgi:GWxTD domain-containing protein